MPTATSLQGRGPFTGYGPGAANLPNWFLNGQGSVAAPSDAVPDTASAGRGLGQANTVGRLSVPANWTVAAPEIRPAAYTLPITSRPRPPRRSVVPDNLFSNMGLAGAAGGAVGSTASVWAAAISEPGRHRGKARSRRNSHRTRW